MLPCLYQLISLLLLLLVLLIDFDNHTNVSCVEINSFELPDCHKRIFDCEESLFDKSLKYLANKRVLFIGDSVTRYQYLSLCYILRHRQPESKHAYPRIVQENSWSREELNLNKRESFFEGSSAVLHPFETCVACDRDGSRENRYYFDDNLKVGLAYIRHSGMGSTEDVKRYFPNFNQIDVVVTNIGFLSLNHNSDPKEYLKNIKSLADAVVWMTTTYQNGEYNDPHWWTRHHNATIDRVRMNAVDHLMCNSAGVLCLDTSWTAKHVHPNGYWNNVYFTEPTYAVFNDQLINLLVQRRRLLH